MQALGICMFDFIFYHIVPFVVILMTLVFVHEFGHYWMAIKNGIHVEVFSIGMGPEIWGHTDKNGTRWRVSIFPLGGYVRMLSDADASSNVDYDALQKMSDEQKQKAHHAKTPWQRIQVSAGGPLANYIFAAIVMMLLFFIVGEKMPTNDNQIGIVRSGTPAAMLGLQPGDRIVKIDDHEIKTFEDIVLYARTKPHQDVHIHYQRQGIEHRGVVKLDARTSTDEGSAKDVGVLGVEQSWTYVRHSLWGAFAASLTKTVHITWLSLKSIGQMISGAKSTKDLMGPLGIAKSVADFARADLASLISIGAFLSISLGFVNLLPIPMLDGGHIVMYLIEVLRGEPLNQKTQEIISSVGFAVIIMLFLVSTWNDIGRFAWAKSIFAKS